MQNNTKNLMMAAAMVGLNSAAQGAVTFTESTDFSNSVLTPTLLTLGTNQVIGAVDAPSDFNDFFTLQGFTVGSVTIEYERSASSPTNFLRFAVYDGDTSTELDSSFLQSGSFTVNAPASGNLIFGVGASEGIGTTGYSFTTTDVVPEPSTSALVSLAAIAALARRKRQ